MLVNKTIELLAPGGDVDSIKAAILAGADAVYCGLHKFNARNRAANISFEELQGIIRLAHQYNCKVFITLNILFVDTEIPALFDLLNKLTNTNIDGVIVQDFGLFYLISHHFSRLNIHASTQLTTHNEGQIKFLSLLKATRVNLSRELSFPEVKALTEAAHKHNCLTEVFVHGSYCLSFSGICYMSSVQSGNSGNRGRCSQPCRDRYVTTAAGKNYPLNLKDNSAYAHLQELYKAGVDSLKIEGRIKKYDYVFKVVEAWRKQIDRLYRGEDLIDKRGELYKVFNRDFSDAFLTANISDELFIDNPRDHSIEHLSATNASCSKAQLEEEQLYFYEEKEGIKSEIGNLIQQISVAKITANIFVSGACGFPLSVKVKTPDKTFEVHSTSQLSATGAEPLDETMLMKRLKAINETEYQLGHLSLDGLQPNVYLPFKELTAIKQQILSILNNSAEIVKPQKLPLLEKQNDSALNPTLSILIDSPNDLKICTINTTTIYYQLPDGLKNECEALSDLFLANTNLIPWFPSVLIGEDFFAAVDFLHKVKPKYLVTNNTGIAHEAYLQGIKWIAGPYLNVVNSFSLRCLKETFNCSGAFISNEISKTQLQQIRKPNNFELYYSIYHPILLMTSRQCLFHRVTGCKKNQLDKTCLSNCEKTATITNMKGNSFIIEKRKGCYNNIYHSINCLNTEALNLKPNLFNGFLIDLRTIKTETSLSINKQHLIDLFQQAVGGQQEAIEQIEQSVSPTTNSQFKKGI
jgi:putative protease